MPTTTSTPAVDRRASEQTAVWYLGAHVQTRLSGDDTEASLAILDHRANRGYHAPMYRNTRAAETILVRSGQVLVSAAGTDRMLTAGDAIWIPRDCVHGFMVVSEEAQLTTIHEPAGFEVFQKAVGSSAPVDIAGTPSAPAALTMLSIAETAALAAEHGLEVVGPPPGMPTSNRP